MLSPHAAMQNTRGRRHGQRKPERSGRKLRRWYGRDRRHRCGRNDRLPGGTEGLSRRLPPDVCVRVRRAAGLCGLLPEDCTGVVSGAPASECIKRVRDGALFVTGQIAPFRKAAQWTACTDTERQRVQTACSACPHPAVLTSVGCLAWSGVHDAVAKRLEEARARMSACEIDADCACVPERHRLLGRL
jgi:hypothetical protein